MKQYRFVAMTHHQVSAETLEGAIGAFSEMKRKGLPPTVCMVSRIEVQGEKGAYAPVDRPLRAGALHVQEKASVCKSA